MRRTEGQKIRRRVASQIGLQVGNRLSACVAEPVENQLWTHPLVGKIGSPVWQQILGSPTELWLVRPVYLQAKEDYNDH